MGSGSCETADVGMDDSTPVTGQHGEGDEEISREIEDVTVELK